MPGMIRERERRVNSRENEKDDRKLALVRRVVANEKNRETKNKTKIKKNREKMGKARTSAKPVRLSATSNLHVLSSMPGKEERDRRMGKGPRKTVDRKKEKKKKKGGQGGDVRYSFSLSHIGLLSLLRCPE